MDADVALDAAFVFFVFCSTLADFVSVLGALASAVTNFVSLFVGLPDLPLETVACAPFALTVGAFVWAPVTFTVEPFDLGPPGAFMVETFGADALTVAPLGAPPLGVWVFAIVGLGVLVGFGGFGPASAPTASTSPNTTRIISRRMEASSQVGHTQQTFPGGRNV